MPPNDLSSYRTDLPAGVRELHAALADADRDHFAWHVCLSAGPFGWARAHAQQWAAKMGDGASLMKTVSPLQRYFFARAPLDFRDDALDVKAVNAARALMAAL